MIEIRNDKDTGMSIFFWKKNIEIDAFANSLASELYSNLGPEQVSAYFKATKQEIKRDKLFKQVEMILFNSLKEMQQFRVTHALGTYGKARLLLKFNERLEELGYDNKAINGIKDLVLLKMPR
jgi:hypothetical protein